MTITVRPPATEAPPAKTALRLLQRELSERANTTVTCADHAADIILSVDAAISPESFRIDLDGDARHIVAGNPAGLLYGVGRFLRESVSGNGTFAPCSPVPLSVPDCRMRGMYFAHNFHNWYRSAPMDELTRYVEDLALWGLNAIAFPCDTNPQCPPDEITNVMLPRQLELIRAAPRLRHPGRHDHRGQYALRPTLQRHRGRGRP